ncbi:MAG: TolC family protein, partial [Verrucomicrobiota bacterium]
VTKLNGTGVIKIGFCIGHPIIQKLGGIKIAPGQSLPSVPGSPPAGVPSTVLERRPDLLAAERRLAAADKRVIEAKRSLLPAISITGSYGTSTPDLSEILNSDFNVWNIANGIAQPILDGQRLRQTVKVREADQEQALANYQQTALTAFQEVETALASEKYLRGQEEALTNAVSLLRGALSRARNNYAEGTGDVLTILRAQQQFIQSETNLINVRRARLDNRVDLHLALGGSFQSLPREKT